MKFYGDNKYEIEGFTTVNTTKNRDSQYMFKPNSSKYMTMNFINIKLLILILLGGQPPLNLINANYIFKYMAKIFCFMLLHEETQRNQHIRSKIKY